MKLHIAIPVMQELDFLPETLACIADQFNADPFHVYICVNQPDAWWNDPQKQSICTENQAILKLLSEEKRFPLTVFDYASPGKGWQGKQNGVGHARKILFDYILKNADDKDIIISMDADTSFNMTYFSSVRKMFTRYPKHAGLISPYYHRLTKDDRIDRAILRYEIYMRCYALNLCRIGSPYNFTALGSAMAIPAAALRAVDGITPYSSGEDFYLAQKLRKYGELILNARETVFPAARLSDRVAFGTGPALIKGLENNWDSYPIYPPEFFEPLQTTFALFPTLFKKDCVTPMDDFLAIQFPNQNIWEPLRKNFKTEKQFIRACHQKIDGLRTLQFLRTQKTSENDNENLVKNFQLHCNQSLASFDFQNSLIEDLNYVRNGLFEKEQEIRCENL